MPERGKWARLALMAAASAAFTYLFFIEYLPPLKHVHVPYDLESYHYPMVEYAFQSVRSGRLPTWDAALYCGISLAGNTQAELFYPPLWLLFAANLRHEHLSFATLQIFVFLHVWLAFMLAYAWLRARGLAWLSCALGAGVFAFSGYTCLQLQHLGLVIGFAWFPLGLLAIDESVRKGRWLPLWKLVLASAMCFLGGYAPTWFVFAVCMGVYTVATSIRPRAILGTLLALIASLGVAMVQLLPAWEASKLMLRESRYGGGIQDPSFYLSYLSPNYFNFGLHVPVNTNPGREYLYLGGPGLAGIALLMWRRRQRALLPFFAVGAAGLILVTNPLHVVSSIVSRSSLLDEICRSWYFLAALTLAAAPLAAYGIDDFLRRNGKPIRPRIAICATLAAIAYSCWQLVRSMGGGSFAFGPRSMIDPLMTLIVVLAMLYAARSQKGWARVAAVAAILMVAGVDYKVFGAPKRFNARPGPGPRTWPTFPGMDAEAYRQLRIHPEYRVIVDSPGGPFPPDLRRYGLASPQGFDPFFPEAYRKMVVGVATFYQNWLFDVDPARTDALDLFGVRYFLTTDAGAAYAALRTNSAYRLVGAADQYFHVFEYSGAHPTFGWERESADQSVSITGWIAERRAFSVNSTGGGQFIFREQFLPGWIATVDGAATRIAPWRGVFQAVAIPPGAHRLEFRYQPRALLIGAWISAVSIILLSMAGVISGRRANLVGRVP